MKIEIERSVVEKAHQALSLLALKFMASVDEKSWAASTSAINALAEVLAAPNSVEFDGIETEPAQQDLAGYECYAAIREGGRNACEDEYFAPRPAHDNEVSRTLFRHGFDRGYDRASAQQDPDALHLAAMDLARKQADRIAELEAEVTRFRADAMNEKAARQALEQQLAAREPLTDEQIKDLYKVPWVFDTARQWVRIIESAHGITQPTTTPRPAKLPLSTRLRIAASAHAGTIHGDLLAEAAQAMK